MPPSEITGTSVAGGGLIGSVTVRLNVAVNVPKVAVTVRLPAFVGVAAMPACPEVSVRDVFAVRSADPAVTVNVTRTPPAGRPVLPVNLTINASVVVPVVAFWLLPLTISIFVGSFACKRRMRLFVVVAVVRSVGEWAGTRVGALYGVAPPAGASSPANPARPPEPREIVPSFAMKRTPASSENQSPPLPSGAIP